MCISPGIRRSARGTVIYPFASLGTPPQSVHYKGEPTRLTIGAKCQIRESVTINTGTVKGGGVTTVGDDCFLMVGSHVAHDCHVGNNVVFANNAAIGGHCRGRRTTCSSAATASVHQFTRLGESAMVAGYSAVREDVIPYGYVLYPAARLAGINVVGMRRRGVTRAGIAAVRAAYQTLFEGEGEFSARVEQVAAEHADVPQVAQIVDFLRSAKRPVMMTRLRGHVDDFE